MLELPNSVFTPWPGVGVGSGSVGTLLIVFVVIATAVIVMGLGDIVPVVCSVVGRLFKVLIKILNQWTNFHT